MTKTKSLSQKELQMFDIAKRIEDEVGDLSTITNLKKILNNLGISSMTKKQWDELIVLLERYYIISKKEYPFEIYEEILDI